MILILCGINRFNKIQSTVQTGNKVNACCVCVWQKMRLHASSLQQTRIHALCMQVHVILSSIPMYVRSCWLKFSNMALQLYSEHHRFVCGPSDYSNHMNIIYLRQIGTIRNFKIFFPTVSIFSPATELIVLNLFTLSVLQNACAIRLIHIQKNKLPCGYGCRN